MPVLGVVQLQAILCEAFPDVATPVVEDVNKVFALLSFPVSANHGRPGGTLSGPVMMSLADTAAWVAIMSQIGPVLLAVTIVAYLMFTLESATAKRVGSDALSYGTAFVIFGVFRYLYLVHRRGHGTPTDTIFGDRPLLVTVFLWGAYSAWLIYRV